MFQGTVRFWQKWLSACTYRGRWREQVQRSALALKLLTFEPTGAIVAAPTTSLPEVIGGTRNWDYRYTWLRDAAFTIYAFLRIGFRDEAAGFMNWIANYASKHMSPNVAATDALHDPGRQRSSRADVGSLGGIPWLPARTHRQCRRFTTPTRRLWRVDGLVLPLQQIRQPDLLRHVGEAPQPP